METIWNFIQSWQLDCTKEQFFRAVEVWITKAHTVNRRLIGTTVTPFSKVKGPLDDHELMQIVQNIRHGTVGSTTRENSGCIVEADTEVFIRDLVPKQLGRFHSARELIIKDLSRNIIIFHPVLHLSEQDQPVHDDRTLGYKLEFDVLKKCFSLYVTKDSEEPPCTTLGVSVQWLREVLLPKLLQWVKVKDLKTEISSLKLVPIEKYTLTYQRLKEQYGKDIVKNWPEKTDPHKFVYEDVAIAAYLLLLWEEERERRCLSKKQSFVDLGCGNGLLVHLLTKEGHSGVGIDIRKRKIWDIYGDETCLQEGSITPHTLFPNYDWLIGNHSDELTPWIPVLAAKSSRKCNFFVLPCCPWDFMSKFSPKYRGLSQYGTYLKYVQEIIEVCGFIPEEDMLRIPSTKRVCFVGQSRTYPTEEWASREKEIEQFVRSQCPVDVAQKPLLSDKTHSTDECVSESDSCCDCDNQSESPDNKRLKMDNCEKRVDTAKPGSNVSDLLRDGSSGDASQFVTMKASLGDNTRTLSDCCLRDSGNVGFKPREFKDEQKSHCLSVEYAVREKFVKNVFETLLKSSTETVRIAGRETTWHKGGKESLGDIAKLFDKEDLFKLKKECGGLQTLLRNHHHIFLVRGGCVELRDWTQMTEHDNHQTLKKKAKGQHLKADPTCLRKTKLCYFHSHHPDGCPLDAEMCRFAHGTEELRTKDS